MRRLCAGLARLLSGWALFVAALFAGQQSWKAVCLEGSPASPVGKCRVELGAGTIDLHAKKAWSMSVPAAAITTVIYAPTRFRRSDGANVAGPCSGSPQGCGLLYMAVGATWLVLYPMKGTHHFVSISWEDRGAQQEILLQLDKHDYLRFLEELRQITGREWRSEQGGVKSIR